MNRRDFIKTAAATSVIPYTVSASIDSGHSQTAIKEGSEWPYYVQCYIRQQGEWVFSDYRKGSFAPEIEYMSFEEEKTALGTDYKYYGFMYDSKLHFKSLTDAVEFIELHARCINVEAADVAYDIYWKNDDSGPDIHSGHFWYDWETGRETSWTSRDRTNYLEVESG